GEDDAIFGRCREFVESMPFGLMHVFSYSPRPGTPAAEWERPSARDAAFREGILLELAARKARAFAESQLGAELEVLVESGAGAPHGWTDNYLKAVFSRENPPPPGTLCCGRITNVLPGTEREVTAEI
ncbi:MAG: hypothetical protein J6S21_03885, partial [Victivallales bacterium]|nr:hypothetical protein [Victivallales bacterium]